MNKWINLKDEKPEKEQKVIVYFKNEYNKKYQTVAIYIPHRSVLAEDFMMNEFEEDWCEYDHERDCYWTPEGFYEWQYAPDVGYYLNENITHWMKLPNNPI